MSQLLPHLIRAASAGRCAMNTQKITTQIARGVVALTEATAAIQKPTGAITIYRRHNKPPLACGGNSR